VFFYFLPQIASLENAFKVLLSLKPWAIALAIAGQLISYYGSGLTISRSAGLSGKRTSVMDCILIFTASTSVWLVAGGMLGSTASLFRWIKAKGGDNKSASLATSLPQIFIVIVLVLISLAGMVFLLIMHDLTTGQAFTFFAITFGLAIFCLLFILAVRYKDQATGLLTGTFSRFSRLIKKDLHEENFSRNVKHVFTTWDYLIHRGWKGSLLGSTLNIFFDILTMYFVFLAAIKQVLLIVLITG